MDVSGKRDDTRGTESDLANIPKQHRDTIQSILTMMMGLKDFDGFPGKSYKIETDEKEYLITCEYQRKYNIVHGTKTEIPITFSVEDLQLIEQCSQVLVNKVYLEVSSESTKLCCSVRHIESLKDLNMTEIRVITKRTKNENVKRKRVWD